MKSGVSAQAFADRAGEVLRAGLGAGGLLGAAGVSVFDEEQHLLWLSRIVLERC